MSSSNDFTYLFQTLFAEEKGRLTVPCYTPEQIKENNTLLCQRMNDWCTRLRLRNLSEYLENILEDTAPIRTLSTFQVQSYHEKRKEAIRTLALLSVFYDLVQHPPLSLSCADARRPEVVEPLAAIGELLVSRAPAPYAVIYAPVEEIALSDRQALERIRWK
ncbi:MAG: hypothetical protein AABY00_03955 [Nanoarchaeota archaeon]